MTGSIWSNDETDLHWVSVHGSPSKWVQGVMSLDLEWTGDAMTEEGCQATAEVSARLETGGQVLASMGNGDGLVLVRKPCGPRDADYVDGDVVARLTRCAVVTRRARNLIAHCPSDVRILELSVSLEGTLRLW